jgi:hypothetical protein
MRREAKVMRDQDKRRRWVANTEFPETLYAYLAVARAMRELKAWDSAATLLRRVLKSANHRLHPDIEMDVALDLDASLSELAEQRGKLASEAAETLQMVLVAQGKNDAAAEVGIRLIDIRRRARNELWRCRTSDAIHFLQSLSEHYLTQCFSRGASITKVLLVHIVIFCVCICIGHTEWAVIRWSWTVFSSSAD